MTDVPKAGNTYFLTAETNLIEFVAQLEREGINPDLEISIDGVRPPFMAPGRVTLRMLQQLNKAALDHGWGEGYIPDKTGGPPRTRRR